MTSDAVNDPREPFRAEFLRVARQRHARVLAYVARLNTDETAWHGAAAELHVLWGEAAMLAFDQIARYSEAARAAAKHGDRRGLEAMLSRLQASIEMEGPS